MRRELERKSRKNAPPIEDTRVSDAWRREENREKAAKREKEQRRRMASMADGGSEGAKIQRLDVRVSASRSAKQSVRSKPGTFEWRYGRRSDALYHAGAHFAILWERAGTADAKSPDLLSEGGQTQWKGLPDGRAAALDEVRVTVRELGKLCSARLVDYCAKGLTTKQIAIKYGAKERDMAPVLEQDLRACAMHFRFL